MKIYLIGMPGAGKTTLGKRLADELNVRFVDLDQEIENEEQKSVPEIFASLGEDHFRSTESMLLKRWSAGTESFVMATGGGAPCFYDGINVINESGVSIFLHTPLETLIERTYREKNRPLLASTSRDEIQTKIEALLQRRLPIYQQAKFTLQSPTVDQIIDVLRLRK
jgi:shikimate kinase